MAAPIEHEPEYLLPLHRGPWTLDDVLALPDDSETGQRVELVGGGLLVSPIGNFRHQRLIGDAYSALRNAAPRHLEATVELNVQMPHGQLLIPDFTVVRRRDFDGVLFPVEDVVLVGEVISPTGRTQDKVLKRDLYAKAGVPFYLLVDPETKPVCLTLLALDGDEYAEAAVSRDGVLAVTEPFPVRLDLLT
ncbi:Uma2 family endonuclease [Labedaea rhizosphaerae]|uniref:Uma2 family endonuclease n=1 Tax=Labedaea rhizosphaerae TaxID=598644 RepID=A0A4R6SAS0_LABRH|nr:Uma2 family endonuclease [Labedaea rhizosphaerae]TDP97139.1 Uma2 family endonuclease [Labedaea rhizosphaerae]